MHNEHERGHKSNDFVDTRGKQETLERGHIDPTTSWTLEGNKACPNPDVLIKGPAQISMHNEFGSIPTSAFFLNL